MSVQSSSAPACSRVSAYAPATVANLGVGFDILGMALNAPGDTVTAEFSPRPGVELVAIDGDDGRLSLDPNQNTACIAARETLRALDTPTGVRLWIEKGLPLASGLGSSAASATAAAVAVNALYGGRLDTPQLLAPCLAAEAAVSGRHADNIAPALWGGIVLITGLDSAAIHRLPLPDRLHIALVTPNIAVPTAQARAVLPESVSLRALVTQTSLVALLIHALHTNNLALLGRAIQQDPIIEPARASLIPGLAAARSAAHDAGALACVISGSGPTLCAFCDQPQVAQAVAAAFDQVYQTLGIPAVSRTACPSSCGARIQDNHSMFSNNL